MKKLLLVGSAAVIGIAGAAEVSLAQTKKSAAAAAKAPAAGRPTATYWMSADTTTGMSAMAGGMAGMAAAAMGGGRGSAPQAAPERPSVAGAVIGGLLGRGGGLFARKSKGKGDQQQGQAQAPQMPQQDPFVRQLFLQLGSKTRPASAPTAEHLIPPGLRAGTSLPLLTPETAQGTVTGQFERPKGKMLIYWGCGEQARAGQPVTVDFAKLAAAQMPPGFAAGAQIRSEQPPSAGRYPGYGEWPNRRESKQLPASASLVGNHVVQGNYSPEIRFALAPGQDFMGPLRMTANSAAPTGAVPLRWQAVPNATAYFAMATGATADGTIVMWSSSETQMFGFANDYVSPADAARLVQSRVLMSPATTQCTVPAEVQRSVQGAALMMTAYGPEANLAEPKPTGAPASWRPNWTVKLRTKSSHTGMLGMDMAAMMRGQ